MDFSWSGHHPPPMKCRAKNSSDRMNGTIAFLFYLLKMNQPTFCIRNPNRINPSFSKWIFLQYIDNYSVSCNCSRSDTGFGWYIFFNQFQHCHISAICCNLLEMIRLNFLSISRSDKVRCFPFGVASLWSKRQLYTQRSFPISSTYLNRYLPSDNCISPLCNIRPLWSLLFSTHNISSPSLNAHLTWKTVSVYSLYHKTFSSLR